MQIVIKLSEEDFEKNKTARCDYHTLRMAIKNGTPLPKEHGRLIDADEIIRLTNEIEEEGVEDREDRLYYLFLKTVLRDAPTIIESDMRGKKQ